MPYSGSIQSQAALAGLKDDSFSEGLKGAQNRKLQELILGKQLENKLAEQKAQAGLESATQDKNLTRAQQMVDENAGKNRKIGVNLSGNGGVSISQAESDPASRMAAMQGQRSSMQASRLSGEGKKSVGEHTKTLETLALYNDMLDNPNAYDQKKLQVLGARLVEGNGQRLLDSVVQAMGADKSTLQGTAQNKLNFLLGTAKSGLTPDQTNAMRETSMKYFHEAGPAYTESRDRFKAYAPQIAPDIAGAGNLEGLVNAELATPERLYKSLADREANFNKQAQGRTTLQQPGTPQPPQYNAPTGRIDSLKALLGVGPKAQMASPAPAMQAPMQSPMTQAPAAPQGPGLEQQNAELQELQMLRAKHKR